MVVFRHRLRRDLGHIVDWADHDMRGVTGRVRRIPRHVRQRRGPSLATLLLAGLAVFAFAKLMTAANAPRRSTAEKLLLVILLVSVGALLLSLRRSARRYRW